MAHRHRIASRRARKSMVFLLFCTGFLAPFLVAQQPGFAATPHSKPLRLMTGEVSSVASVGVARRAGPQARSLDVSDWFKPEKPKSKRRRVKENMVPEKEIPEMESAEREALESEYADELLFEYINRARLALATHNQVYAMSYILEAQELCEMLQSRSTDNEVKLRLRTGSFLYYHGKHLAHSYYFPLGTELAEWDSSKGAPYWASNGGVGIKDVQLAYVSLSMKLDETSRMLEDARRAVELYKTDQAQDGLMKLVNASVSLEKKEELPLIKARDNISLAHYFIPSGSFDAARFALRHARAGLRAAQRDDRYHINHDKLKEMEKEIRQAERQIESGNPTLLGVAGVHLEDWWNSLTEWSGTED